MKYEVEGKMNSNNIHVELTKPEKIIRKNRNRKTRNALLLISWNLTLIQYFLNMVTWQ